MTLFNKNKIMIMLSVSSFIISLLLILFNFPEVYMWSVNYKGNSKDICLLASFNAQLIVKHNKTGHGRETKFDLTPTNTIKMNDSYCSSENNSALLSLEWTDNNGKHSFKMDFKRHSGKIVTTILFDLNVDKKIEGHTNSTIEIKNLDKFKEKSRYKCSQYKIEDIQQGHGSMTLEMNDVQWEVFRDEKKKDIDHEEFLNTPEKCESDINLNKSLPIIIGIIMAALVAVVIVVLVIGRIRSRKNSRKR